MLTRTSRKPRERMTLEAKLARIERQLLQQQPEFKYIDLDLSASNVSSANGLAQHMTACSSGTGINQRVGLSMKVRSVEFHFYLKFTSSVLSVTSEDPAYRVYVVVDKTQVGDTSPAVSDFVDQPSLPITQLRQVAEINRFRVLYDSGPQLIFNGVIGTGVSNDSAKSEFKSHLHFKSRALNILTRFNGTATTDIQFHGIYLMISTNMTGAGATDVLDIGCTSRVAIQDA